MPAQRIPVGPARLAIPALAVIGKYAEGRHPNVQHAALANKAAEAEFDRPVVVVHMGPPLKTSEVVAHVAGWIGDLTEDETSRGRHYLYRALEDMVTGDESEELSNPDYMFHPPYERRLTEIPGRYQFRCSCAGLVLWVYERINIPLINWRHPAMPLAEGQVLTILKFQARRCPTLLPPNPADWRVVNAGYLFHALSRLDHEIRDHPYLPPSQAQLSFG